MLEIVQMKFEDIDEVVEIENTCFHIPWTKKTFEKELTENEIAIYIVAKQNNKTVGYAGMWHIVDEGHINNIAVLPENRNCGIGSELIQNLIQIAKSKDIKAITLEVRIGNLTAQKLYTKFGFKVEGIRKRYYTDTGEDAIIMWKYF